MPTEPTFAYSAPVPIARRRQNARAMVMRRIGGPLAAVLLAVPLVPLDHGQPASVAAGVPGPALRPAFAIPAVFPDELTPASIFGTAAAPPFVAQYSDAASALRAEACLTEAIYYEGAMEPEAGQRAIAQVVLNRVRHPAYPHTVCGVVFQGQERTTGCQFTFTCDGSRARAPVPSLWRRANRVARAALAGSVAAQVGLATHYHADYVLPYWSASLSPAGQIGRHLFYRWRGGAGETRAFTAAYAGREPLIAAWVPRAAPPVAEAAGASASSPRGDASMPGFAPPPVGMVSAGEASAPAATPTPFCARPLLLAARGGDTAPRKRCGSGRWCWPAERLRPSLLRAPWQRRPMATRIAAMWWPASNPRANSCANAARVRPMRAAFASLIWLRWRIPRAHTGCGSGRAIRACRRASRWVSLPMCSRPTSSPTRRRPKPRPPR